ncbi:MAG: EAL domain-containing protein [Actinomycetota bacterium]|nr:EAL domain-containing protein [Actinomycetota bacterium]
MMDRGGVAPRRSLRVRGLLVTLVPALALVVAAGAMLLVSQKSVATDRVAARVATLRAQVEDVLSDLVDAETGVGGYAATGDSTFLTAYQAAVLQLPAQLRVLAAAAETRGLAGQLEPLSGQEFAALDALHRAYGASDAVLTVRVLASKRLMDQIRSAVAGGLAVLASEQQVQDASNARLDALSRTVAFTLVGIGVLGGGLAAGFFLTSLARRLSRVEANARLLAQGSGLRAVAGGKDEIASLDASLVEAAGLIQAQQARLDLALDLGRITVFQVEAGGAISDARDGRPLAEVATVQEAVRVLEADAAALVLGLVDAVRTDGVPRDFEAKIDGEQRWLSGRLTRNATEGKGASVLGVLMDVSDTKKAQRAQRAAEQQRAQAALELAQEQGRHNALLLDSAGEGIYSIDTHGSCTSINPVAARLLGFEVAELVGEQIHERIHSLHPDGSPHLVQDCPIMAAMASGEGFRVERDVFQRRDGSLLPVAYSSYPLVQDGVVRGAVVTYTDISEREAAGAERELAAGTLVRAIEAGELRLHYQPKIDLVTGECTAVEALVRWQQEDALVYPDEFIPLAEQTGVIHALTVWVVDEAVRQAQRWREGGRPLSIAINLSAMSFRDQRVPVQLATAAAAVGLPAASIEIELTESTVAEDIDAVLGNLAQFAGMGVRCAIDDFGTGFSSLSYLKQLPVAYLKLDKSFVMNMPADVRDQAIVASTIHLAHSLGMRVVAEGVENDLVLRQLKAAECDLGQGYHWSRPVPAPELERWLDTYAAGALSSTAARAG